MNGCGTISRPMAVMIHVLTRFFRFVVELLFCYWISPCQVGPGFLSFLIFVFIMLFWGMKPSFSQLAFVYFDRSSLHSHPLTRMPDISFVVYRAGYC